MTGQEWLDKYGSKVAWPEKLKGKVAAHLDVTNATYASNKLFWETASYEEKVHQLLEDLAACKCGSSKHHNPKACDACGPVLLCLQMLTG